MTLRSSDLQSDSDLDSIRNSCDVYLETWQDFICRLPSPSSASLKSLFPFRFEVRADSLTERRWVSFCGHYEGHIDKRDEQAWGLTSSSPYVIVIIAFNNSDQVSGTYRKEYRAQGSGQTFFSKKSQIAPSLAYLEKMNISGNRWRQRRKIRNF